MRQQIIFFPYNSSQYLGDKPFDTKKGHGLESSIFLTLKKFLNSRGVDIHTYDTGDRRAASLFVFFDIPYPWDIRAWNALVAYKGPRVLIANESSLIIPFNYWRILHGLFIRVYTWYEPLIDGKKYVRVRLPKSSDGMTTKPKPFSQKKLLVIINKNTKPFSLFGPFGTFGRELYSWRLSAIDYFERTQAHEFDLYGRGWNKPKKYSISERVFGFRKYSSYRGAAENKFALLSGYKFSICFENLADVDGYVTEKIFDCLKARCVPVYWGARDITNYIPKNCFIDFRDFGNFRALQTFLTSMEKKTYNTYIRNIEDLLKSKNFIDMWFEDWFSKFFWNEIWQKNRKV